MSTSHASVRDVEELEDLLSQPHERTIETLAKIEGDILILGVGGKMGPTLARMAKRASDVAGVRRRVIGISRFSSSALPKQLESWGIEAIPCDLLDRKALSNLPDAANVIFMAGMKFGSTGRESMTWAMNTFLPGLVSERFKDSRIVAFSTGNVYGLSPVSQGGSGEEDALNPAGEYAMSCLGRERIFEHFSRTNGTPMSIIRLNYACEMRYGVLLDIAQRVYNGEPIHLSMGYLNAIWQGDASAMSLESLAHASSPPCVLNIAGTELLRVRELATRFGKLLDKPVVFVDTESPDALLSNAEKSYRLFGQPTVGIEQILTWIADWVRRGGATLAKPTHFEERSGRF